MRRLSARLIREGALGSASQALLGDCLGGLRVQLLGFKRCRSRGHASGTQGPLIWVAVKELKLSYYIGETLLFTIYTHYGNLI